MAGPPACQHRFSQLEGEALTLGQFLQLSPLDGQLEGLFGRLDERLGLLFDDGVFLSVGRHHRRCSLRRRHSERTRRRPGTRRK
jgi:hypothetical protein